MRRARHPRETKRECELLGCDAQRAGFTVMTMPSSSRLITVVMLGAGALVGACGGNNNNNGADARVSDANKQADAPGTPDANVQTRDGTLAVTSIDLTDPAVAGQAWGGASISLVFNNITQEDGGNVVFGTGGLGECTVIQYDAGAGAVHKPHPAVDEGTITISGAGIKQGIGNVTPPSVDCIFQSGQYICPINQATAAAGSTYSASKSNGGATISVSGHAYSAADVGSWVNLTGVTNDSAMNGLWPIVNVAGTSAQLGIPPNVVNNALNANFSGAVIVQLAGIGPVPGGQAFVDFIDTGAGTDHVRIQLAANAEYPNGIDSTLSPIGRGMILDGAGTGCTDCAQPHQFPTSAAGSATVSFSVDGSIGDKKGNPGELGDQAAVGLVITGSTTDATVTGLAPYLMPSPVSQYATFTCLFPTLKTGQVPNGAIAAILATNPHRIETRVFRFAFNRSTTDLNTWSTVSGHGLVGHTDIP
jgi:hypothetical protein